MTKTNPKKDLKTDKTLETKVVDAISTLDIERILGLTWLAVLGIASVVGPVTYVTYKFKPLPTPIQNYIDRSVEYFVPDFPESPNIPNNSNTPNILPIPHLPVQGPELVKEHYS